MKVFVLICEAVYDFNEAELTTWVFTSREEARKKLMEDFEKENLKKDIWDADYTYDEDKRETVIEMGEDSCRMYTLYRYNDNHVVWRIDEHEI